MPRVLLALLVLFGAPACQQAAASRNTLSARDRQVTARLHVLEQQVRRLHANQRDLVAEARKASTRLSSLGTRLKTAAADLAHLQDKVGSIGSSVAAAAASADSASSQAAELARRLAVLEKRFEYHLKHDPGST
jgi:chromosome segregation ATPase